MSNRKVTRILLCLLMLWQLLVSATAHSVPMPDVMHQQHQRRQAMSMHAGCHQQAHHSNHKLLDQCPCHGGVCKCSCAGSPALACVAPMATVTAVRQSATALPLSPIPAASPAALLRPPITWPIRN